MFPTATATAGCTSFRPAAPSSARGACPAPDPASSISRTASRWAPTAACSCATARAIASRSSAPTASISRSGPTRSAPPTSSSTSRDARTSPSSGGTRDRPRGGAAAKGSLRVDNWDALGAGPLDLAVWRVYPFTQSPKFKEPPAIVESDGRRALLLRTEGEAMRVGRPVKVDLKATPWLAWEWKALDLPVQGDVREPKRNDQAARIMLMFEGMKGILYVWDTASPVGTESRPDELDIFDRVLIVVRSGQDGVGRWTRERRDVLADYRRVFGEAPRPIKWVGFESHSNDTRSRSAALFGAASFEPR